MTAPDDAGSLLDDLTAARRPWLSPRIAGWYPGPGFDAVVRESMTQQAGWVGDTDFGAGFRDAIGGVFDERGLPRPAVADPLTWANRRLDLPDGGWCVAGIRYRGRNPEKPFVDVVATTQPPTADGLARVAETVVAEYAAFAPRALRVDVGDPDAVVGMLAADDRFASAAVDQYLVAAPAGALADLPAPADVVLRPVPAAAAAERAKYVAALYSEVAQERADLPLWATPSDAESLAAAAEEGLLFDVVAGGERAGLVASCRWDGRALRGFVVEEIVLDAAHRGRGLGPAVLRRLAAELPAADGDVLWGDITAGNDASLRNAQRAGRDVVGGYVWVVPQSLPGL